MKALRHWFRFEAGRIALSSWEWRLMLAVFAWVQWSATVVPAIHTSQPEPVGAAMFFDLTWIQQPEVKSWLLPLLTTVSVIYGLGLLPLTSSALLLWYLVMRSTLENSQGGGGGSHHTHNMVGFVLLGHLLGTLYHYLAVLRSGGWRELRHQWSRPWRIATGGGGGPPLFHRQWHTICQAAACVYVVSGISKLARSGFGWITELVNLPLQFEKNRMNEYHDTLVMPVSNWTDAFAAWVGAYPQWAGVLFGAGLFLELFAFLALWNRRLLAVWGLALIGMHVMISALMNLDFTFNKWVLAVFWVNGPFWIWLAVTNRRSGNENGQR